MPKIKTKAGKVVDVSPETAGHMVHHGYADLVEEKATRAKDDDGETSTNKRTAKKK